MEVTARTIADAARQKTGCAVAPVFRGKKLSAAASQLDKANGGLISNALKNGELAGNTGETLMLHIHGDKPVRRILLVGCGNPAKLDAGSGRKIINSIIAGIKACKTRDASVHLAELGAGDLELPWLCELLGRSAATASYSYRETVKKPKPALAVSRIYVNCGDALTVRKANTALRRGQQLGTGVNLARNLGNLPGNICTPSYLAAEARKMAKTSSKLTTRILEEKQMRELGMGSLLSVTAGTDQPAKLIQMHYKGGTAKQKPYVLVGKGITFDSGGISLKPGAKMDEMKFDMCGAASVFGTMHAVLEMKLPINVVALVAAAENLPSGCATKPGDVVKSMSGQTIEVLNTDAEGRLVLCDALTYAERFKPAAVIDIATLTGACVVALGAHASGMYSNNDKLAEQLTSAGEATYDRAWRMPLWDEYQKQIDTPFADVANVGGPGGGSITAACFLARFTKKYHWAHLDIAGSAWNSSPKAATGRPVSLLTRYLMDRAGV
jgi:leucyl aminopeptidase